MRSNSAAAWVCKTGLLAHNTASHARPGISGGLGAVIIGRGMNHQCRSIRVAQILIGYLVGIKLRLAGPVAMNPQIGQIAAMRPLCLKIAVLLVTSGGMTASLYKMSGMIGTIANRMKMHAMPSRRNPGNIDIDQNAFRGCVKDRRARHLSARIKQGRAQGAIHLLCVRKGGTEKT